MERRFNSKIWLLPIFLFILFLIISFFVCNFSQVTNFDIRIIKLLQKLFAFVDVDFWQNLSNIHHNWWSVIIVFSTLFLVYKSDYKLAILYFFCDFNCKYLTTFVKEIFQRHRPPVELQPLLHPTDFSFPSGHSFNIVVFLGVFVLILNKYVKNIYIKILLISLCVVLMILVGFSRIMLGVHYPTDVAAGFLFGLIFLSIIAIIDIYSK